MGYGTDEILASQLNYSDNIEESRDSGSVKESKLLCMLAENIKIWSRMKRLKYAL
jgi:hypothetical protein